MKKRVGIAILGLSASLFAQDNLAFWTKYKVISINTKASGANVASNVTKFPVLVRLDSVNAPDVFAVSGGAKAGGADIRFANAAGAQKPFEIEHWDGVAKKAAIWVLADSVKGNDSVAALRVYWGNSSAVSASGKSVFDTANGYVGAWHLGNATGTAPRPGSVIGAPAAQVRNAVAPVPGIIGMADTLFGTGASSATTGTYIDLGRDQNFANVNYAGFSNFSTGFSYSGWVAVSAHTTFARIVNLNVDSAQSAGAAGTDLDNRVIVGLRQNGADPSNIAVRSSGLGFGAPRNNLSGMGTASPSYTLNAWTHLFVTKVPGTSNFLVYRDGVLYDTSSTAPNIPTTTRNGVWIGRGGNGDGWYNGKYDNFTLSKTSRSADFVKLSYETQKANAAAVVLGSTQTQTPPSSVAIAKFAYADTNKSADTLAFVAGSSISVTPVLRGGPVDSFKVVGAALPTGLSVNKTTGVLSGSVSAATSAANYAIKAWGHATAGDTLTRTVRLAITEPPADTSTENYATWTKSRAIWLNTGRDRQGAVKIGANVAKFPVLIRFAATDTAYTQALANGADLRFAKANGTTALPYQIEQWNSNGAAVWVLVDTVKANDSLQTIRMLWGKTGATSRSNGSAVFGPANGFAAVWHMNDSLTQTDASGSGNAAAPSATAPAFAASANSLIGRAKLFDGAATWYTVGTDSTALNLNTNAGPYSVSAWANPSSCSARIAAIAKYTNPGNRQWALHTAAADGAWRFTNAPNGLTGASAGEFTADGSTCTAGAWTYLVGTYATTGTLSTESSANAKLFVDGALVGTGAYVALDSATINRGARAYIGRIASNERYMNGVLDEVRVHSVVRDSNWIKLEYGNQRAGQTFALLAKPGIVSLSNATASMSSLGLSVKPAASGLQFRVRGLANGDKAVLSLVDMFGRTVYGASFPGESLSWNGMGNNGQAISSGVYVARVKVLNAQGQMLKVLEHKIPLAR